VREETRDLTPITAVGGSKESTNKPPQDAHKKKLTLCPQLLVEMGHIGQHRARHQNAEDTRDVSLPHNLTPIAAVRDSNRGPDEALRNVHAKDCPEVQLVSSEDACAASLLACAMTVPPIAGDIGPGTRQCGEHADGPCFGFRGRLRLR
jgi:hypothetical protein